MTWITCLNLRHSSTVASFERLWSSRRGQRSRGREEPWWGEGRRYWAQLKSRHHQNHWSYLRYASRKERWKHQRTRRWTRQQAGSRDLRFSGWRRSCGGSGWGRPRSSGPPPASGTAGRCHWGCQGGGTLPAMGEMWVAAKRLIISRFYQNMFWRSSYG